MFNQHVQNPQTAQLVQHLKIFLIIVQLISAALIVLIFKRMIRSFPQGLTLSPHHPVAWPPCQRATGLSTQTRRVTLRQSSAGLQGTVPSGCPSV